MQKLKRLGVRKVTTEAFQAYLDEAKKCGNGSLYIKLEELDLKAVEDLLLDVQEDPEAASSKIFIMLRFVCVIAGLAVIAGAQQATTPVPILRQINSHNDDGSYTYGYESADGSYKIETKGANGEVKGKYGYYDPTGMLREVEYGASRNGFGVTGTGIQTPEAAPASNNHITSSNPGDYDDGSYRPGQYDEGQYVPTDEGQYRPEQQQQQVQQQQQFAAAPAFPTRRASARQFAQQQQYYQPQVQQPYAPVNLPANTFQGHPASNINLNAGSYSINY